jgi:hypothetical protein
MVRPRIWLNCARREEPREYRATPRGTLLDGRRQCKVRLNDTVIFGARGEQFFVGLQGKALIDDCQRSVRNRALR